jgi:hypothetical protein
MKTKGLLLGLVATGLTFGSVVWAQPGAVPAVPVAPSVPAAPGNLWSFLLPNAEQKSRCKTCFCESGIGQMITGFAAPFSLMSGGLIKNRCLQNAILNDLKKPADTPEGAAARVKADEAAAKARRDAVRVLGLVDCNYWPEAIDTLKVALRGDRSECVRFEAALALRNGCCCNKEIVKALEMSVSGSNADGFPAERSDRVRAAAAEALARCPLIETPIDDKKGTEQVRGNELSPDVDPTDYYKKVSRMKSDQIIASARATLAKLEKANKEQETAPANTQGTVAASGAPVVQQRAGSIAGIVSNAFGGSPDPAVRTPFFSNLTRALTGKQENYVQEYINPAPVESPRLPEINTTGSSEIAPPMPLTVEPYTEPRERKLIPAIEFTPSKESMNLPREKKTAPLRDLSMPTSPKTGFSAVSGRHDGDYVQVSPHVRQTPTPAGQFGTPIATVPQLPAPPVIVAPAPTNPVNTPAIPAPPVIIRPISTTPAITPIHYVPTTNTTGSKVSVIDVPANRVANGTPATIVQQTAAASSLGEPRYASAPPTILQTASQPRNTLVTTLEIGR